MGLLSFFFPQRAAKRRRRQDQNQQQQSQSQSQSQSQLTLQPTTRYPQLQMLPPYNNAIYPNISNNNYQSLTSYHSRPSKKIKIVVPVINKIVVPVLPTKIIIPNEALLSQQHHHQQQLLPSSITNESNYYIDNVSFSGNGDEWEIESQGVLTANDINLHEYIKVVEIEGNNGTTYVYLHIATNILNKDEKPYRACWNLTLTSGTRQLTNIYVNSKELWQNGIIKHLKKEPLSDLAETWAKSPQGKAKNNALAPFLEALRTQMINHPIINTNIKAVIIQSLLSGVIVDDSCTIDQDLAESLTVVLSSKNQVSLNIATDVGELSSVQQHINFYQTNKVWGVTINVPSNASDMWKVLQPKLSALKSKLLDGIDLDREEGLTIPEKTTILQRAQHYILSSKKMSRAVQVVVDNTEGQATPTSNDIYLRPPNRLDGGDLARVQNEATVALYEQCHAKSIEIQVKYDVLDDSVAGKELIDVMRDAATAIVSSLTCNIFMYNKSSGSWRQLSLERAIRKTTKLMMYSEYSKQRKARTKEELAKRAVMLKEYEGLSQIKGLPLIDTTKPEDVNRLISFADDVVNANPSIKYWYAGLGSMTSQFELAGDEGIQSALRNLFCKPTGRGLSALDVGPTPNHLCQAVVFVLAAVVGSARGRLGEIPLIEYLIDKERRTNITCINQGLNGCDTDKRDGVERICLLFLTGYKNLGQRLRSNEMNLCLHGCRSSAVARWNASIPTAEQNFIEWDPRVRHERESTTEPGKIRVTYSLVR